MGEKDKTETGFFRLMAEVRKTILEREHIHAKGKKTWGIIWFCLVIVLLFLCSFYIDEAIIEFLIMFLICLLSIFLRGDES